MTRKDYILIAASLRQPYLEAKYAGHRAITLEDSGEYADCKGRMRGVYDAASEIAESLTHDNPRFDREHFLAVVRGERELNSRPKRIRR